MLAYSAACLASPAKVTVPAASLGLTLPSGWDGPESNVLSLASTVVTVAAGGILGSGVLYILVTM